MRSMLHRLYRPAVVAATCWLLALLAVTAVAAQINTADYDEVIRVGCVGDSITFGAGIRDRQQNSYPVQLGRMLGEKWETRNFGVNGATLLKKGDKPYWTQKAFADATAYRPHVVIIKLGTNDTKPQNWQHEDQFEADCKALIAHFAALPSKPRIWLCCPVPAYPERWGIRDSVIKEELIPLIRATAAETGVSLIDLYKPLSGKPELFPDKIHPNAAGARLMAEAIYEALTGKAFRAEPRAVESPVGATR